MSLYSLDDMSKFPAVTGNPDFRDIQQISSTTRQPRLHILTYTFTVIGNYYKIYLTCMHFGLFVVAYLTFNFLKTDYTSVNT